MNTMMKTDLEQVGSDEMIRAAAISQAESMLDRNHLNGGVGVGTGGRASPSFRHAAGTILGALRLQNITRGRGGAAAQEEDSQGKEMGKWEIQQPAVGEEVISVDSKESTTNQVEFLFCAFGFNFWGDGMEAIG